MIAQEMCELDMRETEILFFLLVVIMIRSRKTGSTALVAYLRYVVWCHWMYCNGFSSFAAMALCMPKEQTSFSSSLPTQGSAWST